MINKKFIQRLKQEHDAREGERRQIIGLANVVLHDSKRVIFSLHRGDSGKAAASLSEIEKILNKLKDKFGQGRLAEEGAYQAGAEEYVEAKLFYQFLNAGKLDKIREAELGVVSFLGGICDLTGELLRFAINQAAAGNFQETDRISKAIGAIMAELVEFDMTGYLRTKYDQAKTNLRKIEQVVYEIKIRK